MINLILYLLHINTYRLFVLKIIIEEYLQTCKTLFILNKCINLGLLQRGHFILTVLFWESVTTSWFFFSSVHFSNQTGRRIEQLFCHIFYSNSVLKNGTISFSDPEKFKGLSQIFDGSALRKCLPVSLL